MILGTLFPGNNEKGVTEVNLYSTLKMTAYQHLIYNVQILQLQQLLEMKTGLKAILKLRLTIPLHLKILDHFGCTCNIGSEISCN